MEMWEQPLLVRVLMEETEEHPLDSFSLFYVDFFYF